MEMHLVWVKKISTVLDVQGEAKDLHAAKMVILSLQCLVQNARSGTNSARKKALEKHVGEVYYETVAKV